MKFRTMLFFIISFFLVAINIFSVSAEELYPYQEIGDGQSALTVTLTLVDGVVLDPEGNVYISHRSKNRIRKIDKNGIITTVAGNGQVGYSGDGGPAIEASLNFPAELAFDRGNLYIADRNNHRVRKVDSQGIITTVAGNGIADYEEDDGPAGMPPEALLRKSLVVAKDNSSCCG